ncbi:MAG: class I SAM-dependent methyltransferase [Phycisphaeraceae bacterium]
MSFAHDHNKRAWDDRAKKGLVFARPASGEDIETMAAKLIKSKWLDGGVKGKRVLCLAAGGGRQSVLYAEAGAHVTVVDISPAMLALDRQVATDRKLDIRVVEASMDDLSPLTDAYFDVVIQPVSTCYVPDIRKVYDEVARVMAAGGIYSSQHKQPVSLQSDTKPAPGGRGYELTEAYYRRTPLPEVTGSIHRESGTIEYLHRWEQLVGGMCRAGFVIEDLVEPNHMEDAAEPGTFGHRSRYVPPYVLIKARRISEAGGLLPGLRRLWTP